MFTRQVRLLSAIIPFLTGSSLGAATINWGAATGITGELDVSTNGTLVRAYNFGVDGGTDPTPTTTVLNGVAFTNFSTAVTTNPSHEITGAHTIIPKAGGNSNVIAFTSGRSGSGTPYTGLTSAYQSFISTVLYAGGAAAAGGSARNSYTFTLESLTIGQTYQLQIWFNDSRSGENRGGTIAGGPTVDQNTSSGNASGGVGQYVIGEFTADATTQSFDFTATGSATVAAIMNGYQLRTIPEPSLTLLGGLGFAIAAVRRRRI